MGKGAEIRSLLGSLKCEEWFEVGTWLYVDYIMSDPGSICQRHNLN